MGDERYTKCVEESEHRMRQFVEGLTPCKGFCDHTKTYVELDHQNELKRVGCCNDDHWRSQLHVIHIFKQGETFSTKSAENGKIVTGKIKLEDCKSVPKVELEIELFQTELEELNKKNQSDAICQYLKYSTEKEKNEEWSKQYNLHEQILARL